MWKKLSKRFCKAAGIFALLVLCAVAVAPLLRFMRRHSPDPLSRLLEQANENAWLNNWIEAAPLYREAEALCIQRNDQSCALYSHVSQIPLTRKQRASHRRLHNCLGISRCLRLAIVEPDCASSA